MAREKQALAARGVQLVAISPDMPAKARAMADKYGIDFPLLSDPENTLAKKYVGVSTDGYPFPGAFVLAQDGSVLFRRVGAAKEERVYAAELLEIVDEKFALQDKPKAKGFARNMEVRAGLALGVERRPGDTGFTAGIGAAVKYSLGRYAAIGLDLGASGIAPHQAHLAGFVQGHWPFWKGVGRLYMLLPLGVNYDFEGDFGRYQGLRAGVEIEAAPNQTLYIEAGAEVSTYKAQEEELHSTSILMRSGLGWKF